MTTKHRDVPPRLRILRRREVESRTGLCRSTIYARAADGTFPKPVGLGGRAVGWLELEVDEWLEQRVALSRPAGK